MKKSSTFLTTLPNFIEGQCASFCWFLVTGLLDSLKVLDSNWLSSDKFDIHCYYDNFFYVIYDQNVYNPAFIKTSTVKLYVPINIQIRTAIDSKQIIYTANQELSHFLFIGEIPLMTDRGTFIINGYEKICINQLIRSPGLYVSQTFLDNSSAKQSVILLPQRGAWLRFMFEKTRITLSIDKGQRFDLRILLKILNFSDIADQLALASFYALGISSLPFCKLKEQEITTFKQEIESKILDNNLYNLGILGRFNLNTALNTHHIPVTQYSLTLLDFVNLIRYVSSINFKRDVPLDFDDLTNKHICSSGELLQNQIIIGLQTLQRSLSQNIIENPEAFSCHLLYSEVFSVVLQTFFSSSQLIQFFDQINSLSELSHSRRIRNVSIGSSTTISLKQRDIHSTYFGRLCPIETGEGSNAGLTSSLATYTRLNELGMLETPFFLVSNGYVLDEFPVIFLTTYEEQFFFIAPSDTPLTSSKRIPYKQLAVSFQNNLKYVSISLIQLIPMSSLQFFSFGVSLIPFIEHNDANRVLMGANMQRQAVTLLYSTKPIVGTGIELALASTFALKSYIDGFILSIKSDSILIVSAKGRYITYFLKKFIRSNQNSCINQRAIVWRGEFIKSGQILADSSDMDNGELALGQNLLLAYMIWNGFNFEDSILINERLIFSDLFTSITILNFIINIRYDENNVEYFLTPFNVKADKEILKNLDNNGIIKKGSFVKPYDILVGKMRKFSQDYAAAYLIIHNFQPDAITSLGYNTSILASSTCYGRVLASIICSYSEQTKQLDPFTCKIYILVAQLRKLEVGDKLSGRHGNKGIIAKILAQEDMPYLPNGQSMDLLLNPLGVPSRMNIGQLFEGLLGFSGNFLEKRFIVRPFDEQFGANASRILLNHYLLKSKQFTKFFWIYNQYTPGKIILRDGKTGNCFDNPILVCKSYIIQLRHFASDKIQARSSGGYSLVSQQPLHGKTVSGGQRFGEMEIWALEAFGAAYTLHELLTVKSDDVIGRHKILDAIRTNTFFVHQGIPESFNVLIFELKALGLNLEFSKFNSLSF